MITSKQKWLPFWRFFCHLCSQRGLELHVWFHSVQSECVAVRGEKDHVVFWCSNGIGCHCWAFDQFHKEWPVRKSYCLTEVCEWMFFHFSSMFSLCIPPRLYTLLGVYYKSMFSQLLAHFVCQNVFISQRACSGKIIVLFMNCVLITAQWIHSLF